MPPPIDLLVIGTGVAGATAALQAADRGQNVVVLSSSSNVLDSNSFWAQGGIIYKARDEPEEPKLLASDIERAGAGRCKIGAVEKLASEGPRAVEHFLFPSGRSKEFAVPFDREEGTGHLALCVEASHNRPRIIHWRDQTGRAIMESMVAAVAAHPNIDLRTGTTAIDFILKQPKQQQAPKVCVGATVFTSASADLASPASVERLEARATLLATGGCGEIYEHTSNPSGARGDGLAMALRAGATVGGMEYMQFHPTTLYVPGERRFLLTEALRGDGAILRDPITKEPFAKEYHPDGELAPRDVVSRMIVSQMAKTKSSFVLLDISHRGRPYLSKRFPAIYTHCKARGLDMAAGPLPVVPAAHYFCGGVEVDLEGRTSIPGLFAAGEVSWTGLHGANRLASTSLLEGIVWGAAAADAVADEGKSTNKEETEDEEGTVHDSFWKEPNGAAGEDISDRQVDALWSLMKRTMWRDVGIERSPVALAAAATRLASVAKKADGAYTAAASDSRGSAKALLERLAIRNASSVAVAVATAAAANKSSAGTHYLVPDPGQSLPFVEVVMDSSSGSASGSDSDTSDSNLECKMEEAPRGGLIF